MKQNFLQQITLYRYRYILGYGLFLAVLIGLLTFELTSVPSGISEAEIQSTTQSAQLQPTMNARIIDLPYHLLQKASLTLLGLSTLSIKLPSVILGALSGIGLMLLLRRWFKHNVSIISALLAISSSIFLISARAGTPEIMVIFWAVYLLLLATLITQEAKWMYGWKVLLGLIVGLSLYTPLSIYVLGAALIAGILHPHARYTLRRYGGPELAGALSLFAISVIPLGIGIWHSPEVIFQLIGLPERLPSTSEYISSLGGVFTYLAGFTAPHIAEVIQPAFNIAMLVLIALGILRSIVDNYATRTYALLIWTAVLVPVIALNTDYSTGLYVPAILFMAIGIETLIREWYSLFPRNPYARLAGLLPLAALIGGVWYYNFSTYFTGYRYSPETAQVFNNDLSILKERTNSISQGKLCVVVPEKHLAFYKILENERPVKLIEGGATFAVTSPSNPTCEGDIVSASAVTDSQQKPATTFWVSDEKLNSRRWHVYF